MCETRMNERCTEIEQADKVNQQKICKNVGEITS